MTRPDRLVAVTGTGTEVGKTWVSVRLLDAARRRGLRTSARKPVQSYEPGAGATDAELLAESTGEPVDDVCPPSMCFGVPMAPPMAADVLGVPAPSLSDLVGTVDWATDVDLGLVETVGGLLSPIAADGDSLALLRALRPDTVVLVAHAGLGTINDCRLTTLALAEPSPIVVLNHYDDGDDLHRRNRAWLDDQCGLDTVAVDSERSWADELVDRIVH